MKQSPSFFRSILLAGLVLISLSPACSQNLSEEKPGAFRFVFLTDIHLTPDRRAVPGFSQAIESVRTLHPDFVLTGGDLIMDALGQSHSRADSLYTLYEEVSRRFGLPVHNTMGNHEIYGIYPVSGANPSHPEYGEKMFEKRLGPSYYAFTHKGWKFMVLNSVEDTKQGKYMGMIDPAQMEWIRKELAGTDTAVPVVLSTHIPLITAATQFYEGATKANDSGTVVVNAKEVLDLFGRHNLKLVLQGHLHLVEEICIRGIRFITGGAVSARWWRGPNQGCEEGFVQVDVTGDQFTWKYVDYRWEVPAVK